MDNVDFTTQIQYVLGEYVYVKIPADNLRNFFDRMFPDLAIDKNADFLSGYMHRWNGGHDLFGDVSKTLFEKGPGEALHQVGHILFTDFPTKAGISIPGLSKAGIGEFLVNHGVAKGFLNISFVDGTLAILAIADGYSNLAAAIAGELHMTVGTFFSTFCIGASEIMAGSFAIAVNPLCMTAGAGFILAGIENVLAGVIVTAQSAVEVVREIVHVVSIDTFLGHSLVAMVLGASIMYWLKRKEISEERSKAVVVAGIKSVLVSGLSLLSGYFSLGYIMGCLAFELGKKMALSNRCSIVYPSTAELFKKEAQLAFPNIEAFSDDELLTFEDNFLSLNCENFVVCDIDLSTFKGDELLAFNDSGLVIFDDDLPKL